MKRGTAEARGPLLYTRTVPIDPRGKIGEHLGHTLLLLISRSGGVVAGQEQHRTLELWHGDVPVAVGIEGFERVDGVGLAHGALLGDRLEERRGPSRWLAGRQAVAGLLAVSDVELCARAERERYSESLMHAVNIRVLKDSNVKSEKIRLGDRHREPVLVRN